MCSVITITTIAPNAGRRGSVWMLFPLWQLHAVEHTLRSASVRLETADHDNCMSRTGQAVIRTNRLSIAPRCQEIK